MKNLGSWIEAFRLRTLPLALAVTGLGNLTAWYHPEFQWKIAGFSILTTLFLQILSNLANDYGDSIHGADHVDRKGPLRAVQSGVISKNAMFRAVLVFAGLSLVSGVWLLWIVFNPNPLQAIPLFFIGLLAIAAAYFYTNGSKPYGYQAMGDISVFIFFGLVGVLGTNFLHTKILELSAILPAVAVGLWSTAVLNINNMRDMPSDLLAGKETIPLKLGLSWAKNYQIFLVVGGEVCLLFFAVLKMDWTWLGFLPGSFLMVYSLFNVLKTNKNEELDPFLKPQAMGTLVSVLGIGFCQWLNQFF